jgi:iron(III) transport system ATP-binding protein
MAEVILENLRKDFDETVAVRDLSLTVLDGEFVTLLGPSGCGKTTSLRMIAGFIEPTQGRITIGDQVVSDITRKVFIPPEKRGIGMVFQSYAVWPHMNVFDNVAYPLKIAHTPKDELLRRVQEALDQVKLTGLGERYPHQLSGGQQQRVALARAVVMNPKVMLLDEPLSNLDAKLREQMRLELKELQAETAMTIIFVTHDQLEAIVLADRIVVMSEGVVEQIGTPQEIYQQPASKFVADFIGVANFIPCRRSGHQLRLADSSAIELPLESPADFGEDVVLVVRPEDIQMKTGQEGIPGVIDRRMFLGDSYEYLVQVGQQTLRVKTGHRTALDHGQAVGLVFEKASFFSGKGG